MSGDPITFIEMNTSDYAPQAHFAHKSNDVLVHKGHRFFIEEHVWEYAPGAVLPSGTVGELDD